MPASVSRPDVSGENARPWLVVGAASDLAAARPALEILAHTVRLDVVVLGDEVPDWLRPLAASRTVVGRRARPLIRGKVLPAAVASVLRRRNPVVGGAVDRAGSVVALGSVAAALVGSAGASSPTDVVREVVQRAWEDLAVRLEAAVRTREGSPIPLRTCRRIVAGLLAVEGLGAEGHEEAVALLPRVALRLVRAGAPGDVTALVALARAAEARGPRGAGPLLDTLDLAVALRIGRPVDAAAVHAATAATLTWADARTSGEEWLTGTASALDLHFDRALHARAASTPLVDDPGWWARPVARSAVVVAADSPRVAEERPTGPSPRVAFLPGTFPQHARSVLEVLEGEDLELDVVELPSGATSGLRPVPRLLPALRAGAGPEELTRLLRLAPDTLARVSGADVVVADWGDVGAVWATRAARRGARVVVRVHSVDALGAALHLVDWGRVTDLVVVAEHVAEVVRGLLGRRLDGVRCHVVPVLAPLPSALPSEAKDPHLVVMTGWAQQVKDPSFALDVLDLLRAEDPRWRLRLLGSGLPAEAWAPEVADRVERGVADGAVEQPGQVEDVYRYLAPAAHVLNTSLREGCPTAVIEGVWAGCLPVVRDWPVYAAHGGATSTLPRTRIVVDPGEAAEALRANAEAVTAGDGEGLAAWVRQGYLDRFDPDRTAQAWRALVAGQRVPEPGSVPR